MRLLYNTIVGARREDNYRITRLITLRTQKIGRPGYSICYETRYAKGGYVACHKRHYAIPKQVFKYIKANYICEQEYDGHFLLIERVVHK